MQQRKKGDYGAATFWQKTKILLAGVFINWITAVVLLTVLAITGLPKIIPDQFTVPGDTTLTSTPVQLGTVQAQYPAEKAGLKGGDTIVRLGTTDITSTQQFIELTKEKRGETVPLTYTRDGKESTVPVTLRDTDAATFGATLGQRETMKATWSAPIVGVATTAQFTWVTFQGLGNLAANFFGGLFGQLSTNEQTREEATAKLDQASASVAGPVGILGIIFPSASEAGLTQVVLLAAIISLTLAVMNALPIPSLDGGRWFVTALFKIMRKPLTKEREESIHGTGFAAMMLLFVVITVADVFKFF